MIILPLLGVAPVAFAARALRNIRVRLWHAVQEWRAREHNRFYFGSLNEYEIDQLARDIGLSRSELLSELLHPTSQSLLPSRWTARDVSQSTNCGQSIRSTD